MSLRQKTKRPIKKPTPLAQVSAAESSSSNSILPQIGKIEKLQPVSALPYKRVVPLRPLQKSQPIHEDSPTMILSALQLFSSTNGIFEIRMPASRYKTVSGYYTSEKLNKAATDICEFDGKEGVYITLNPINPDLYARAAGKLKKYADKTTADSEITHRRWLPLDFDPKRPSGICATDEEKQAAINLRKEVQSFLQGHCWPSPVIADSGNGNYLLYRIDLPNDDEAKLLLQNVLKALDFRFSNDKAEIDKSMFNAARIVRLLGTMNIKGDNLAERPHRRSSLLSVPSEIACVTLDQLKEVATMLPDNKHSKKSTNENHGEKNFDLEDWIKRHELSVSHTKPYENGTMWVLNQCPFNADHKDKAAYVLQLANGAIRAGCLHNSCRDLGWYDLRDKLEPGWREQWMKNGSTTLEEDDKKTHAQVLIDLAQEAEFFVTPDGTAYATFSTNGHKENWPLQRKNFKYWLTNSFFKEKGKPVGTTALNDALNLLEAQAHSKNLVEEINLRTAEHNGKLYIDLVNDDWEVIEVSSSGWKIIQDPPIKFKRAKGMTPLPRPVDGGNIDELRKFVNVTDRDWPLFSGWLVAALKASGPHPIMVLQGTQGSAKSTHSEIIRSLVDPSTSPLRTAPKDEQNLMVMANNSWVIAVDNLSGVQAWLSDAFCRLATGAGFSTRELYSNDGETIFNACRPIILNGIDAITTRGDLADRSIIIDLPSIPEEERKPVQPLMEAFEEARPRILGSLLSALSSALSEKPNVKLPRLPRMADFAVWATAAEKGLGLNEGGFMAAYVDNRNEAVDRTIEADLVATAILKLMKQEKQWRSSCERLLSKLEEVSGYSYIKPKTWPLKPNTLSNHIKRVMPALKTKGIEVDFKKSGGARLVIITRQQG